MKIYPIETGNFKLDGGAMFGVVPKSIWQKTNQPIEIDLTIMLLNRMQLLLYFQSSQNNLIACLLLKKS